MLKIISALFKRDTNEPVVNKGMNKWLNSDSIIEDCLNAAAHFKSIGDEAKAEEIITYYIGLMSNPLTPEHFHESHRVLAEQVIRKLHSLGVRTLLTPPNIMWFGEHNSASAMGKFFSPSFMGKVIMIDSCMQDSHIQFTDTLCHEAIHATAANLNRPLPENPVRTGERYLFTPNYIKEEMVAIMGANFLMNSQAIINVYTADMLLKVNAELMGNATKKFNIDLMKCRQDAITAYTFLLDKTNVSNGHDIEHFSQNDADEFKRHEFAYALIQEAKQGVAH